MKEIVDRLMEAHLEERSYKKIKYEEGEYGNIHDSLLVLARDIAESSEQLVDYLEDHEESDLSDKAILKYLQDIRGSVHSLSMINTPERYHHR